MLFRPMDQIAITEKSHCQREPSLFIRQDGQHENKLRMCATSELQVCLNPGSEHQPWAGEARNSLLSRLSCRQHQTLQCDLQVGTQSTVGYLRQPDCSRSIELYSMSVISEIPRNRSRRISFHFMDLFSSLCITCPSNQHTLVRYQVTTEHPLVFVFNVLANARTVVFMTRF